MKKLLVIGTMCVVSSLGAYPYYISECDEEVETVDDSFFATEEEAKEFHKELAEYYCKKDKP